MLLCPACRREPLVVLEYEDVEVDYCVACRGVWLDAGELELLFGDAGTCAAFLTIGSETARPTSEKARMCPICDRRMRKETTEGAPPVLFDHCSAKHGIWLDHGELASILVNADALGADSLISTHLRRVFAKPEK